MRALPTHRPTQRRPPNAAAHSPGDIREQIRNDRLDCKGRALDAVVNSIKGSLKKGDVVTLVGFGSFFVGKRSARAGRNPRTNEPIKIRAAKVPKFRAGKALKDAVN